MFVKVWVETGGAAAAAPKCGRKDAKAVVVGTVAQWHSVTVGTVAQWAQWLSGHSGTPWETFIIHVSLVLCWWLSWGGDDGDDFRKGWRCLLCTLQSAAFQRGCQQLTPQLCWILFNNINWNLNIYTEYCLALLSLCMFYSCQYPIAGKGCGKFKKFPLRDKIESKYYICWHNIQCWAKHKALKLWKCWEEQEQRELPSVKASVGRSRKLSIYDCTTSDCTSSERPRQHNISNIVFYDRTSITALQVSSS